MVDKLNALLLAAEIMSRDAKTEAVKQVIRTMFLATLLYFESNAELHLYIGNWVYQKVICAPIL